MSTHPKSPARTAARPAVRRLPRVLVALLSLGALTLVSPGEAQARKKKPKSDPSYLYLDGVRERVFWNDGDSFKVMEGSRKGLKARLVGYNTLESYGPVHFWGGFHGWELYRIAKDGAKFAQKGEWTCKVMGPVDGYGRALVECPDLRKAIIRKGYAHVFAVGEEPDAELVEAQRQAQNERLGIWSKGIPTHIVTSIHSTDELTDEDRAKGKTNSYNRVCDTRTGKSFVIEHTTPFKPCDAWCYGASCMVYLPFDVRFGDKRPACVVGDGGERNRLVAAPVLGYPSTETKDDKSARQARGDK